MSQIDTILTLIAQKHLGIDTLETRHADSLEFHDTAVWCIRDALEAAFKAGIEVGEGTVFQFYPPGVEDQLADLERRYRGRSPGEIRVTRFGVTPKGDSYGFKVLAQETLR